MFAAFAAVFMAVKKNEINKEEELTMRVISRLCGFRLVIAFAAVLLLADTAFSAITDPQVDTVDLLSGRTQVALTGTATCANTTDTGEGTATIYQVHGRHLYMGFGPVSFDCSNGTWQATVTAIEDFKFQPGPATFRIDFYSTDTLGNTDTPLPKGAKIKLQ
jgi:hypothetical protein